MVRYAIHLPADLYAVLQTLQEGLQNDLGFEVQMAQVIAWLVRHKDRMPKPDDYLPSPPPPPKTKVEEAHPQLEELMKRGEKIQAIKRVREVSDMGLREAKEYVEKRWNHLFLEARGRKWEQKWEAEG